MIIKIGRMLCSLNKIYLFIYSKKNCFEKKMNFPCNSVPKKITIMFVLNSKHLELSLLTTFLES